MAWMKKGQGNPFGALADKFGSLPNSVGNMHAPSSTLHPDTMKPRGTATDYGATKGNPGGLGNPMAGALTKGTQSPAQHQAVEKAARASANKRRKTL